MVIASCLLNHSGYFSVWLYWFGGWIWLFMVCFWRSFCRFGTKSGLLHWTPRELKAGRQVLPGLLWVVFLWIINKDFTLVSIESGITCQWVRRSHIRESWKLVKRLTTASGLAQDGVMGLAHETMLLEISTFVIIWWCWLIEFPMLIRFCLACLLMLISVPSKKTYWHYYHHEAVMNCFQLLFLPSIRWELRYVFAAT